MRGLDNLSNAKVVILEGIKFNINSSFAYTFTKQTKNIYCSKTESFSRYDVFAFEIWMMANTLFLINDRFNGILAGIFYFLPKCHTLGRNMKLIINS